MITYELQETRGAGGAHRGREVGDIRSARSERVGAGPASIRPARRRPARRPAAMCPAPVAIAPRRGVAAGVYRLRRIVAGVGLAVVSAAAVVALGLLAEVSSAANADPVAPGIVLRGS